MDRRIPAGGLRRRRFGRRGHHHFDRRMIHFGSESHVFGFQALGHRRQGELGEDLGREARVVGRPVALRGIVEDGLSEAGRLGQLDVPPHWRGKKASVGPGRVPSSGAREELLQILEHFGGEFGVRLVQAQDDPAHRKPGVDPLPHQRNGLQELRQTLQAKEVRLQRDNHLIDGRQRVDGQHPQRRRAVNQQHIVLGLGRLQGLAENDFAPGDADQLGLRTREIDVRRDHLNSLAGAGDDLVDRRRVGQHVIDRRLIGTNLDAEVQRKVSLRIEVQQQNLQSAAGQRRGEIGRRGRLSYAAFLIDDRDSSHRSSLTDPRACPALDASLPAPTHARPVYADRMRAVNEISGHASRDGLPGDHTPSTTEPDLHPRLKLS